MSARELIVLGTASQVPTRHRNHNGYFIRWDGTGFLFDPGEGTQRQMIRSGVRAHGIHHIGITHFHGDHCLGMAGLVQRISLDGVPHPVAIHYPASGEVYFKRLRRASIFKDKAHIVPRPITEEGVLATGDTWQLEARRLDHTVPTWGYRIQEPDGVRMLKDRLDALGVRGQAIGQLKREGQVQVDGRTIHLDEVSVARPGQSAAIVMDTRMCPGALELARGVDLLVCESTYLRSEEAEAHERGHLTAAQAATIARDAGARKLVLTHFSQRHPDVNSFLEEAAPIFPDVVAAVDGAQVPVPSRMSTSSQA